MLTFKQFIKNQPLKEALNDDQIKQVKAWTPPTNKHLKFSDGAMDNQDRVHMPLEHPELESKHADGIHEFLSHRGYTPHDYKAGIVKDNLGRVSKIGGALVKSKAHPDMLKDYNTDPARVAAKKSDMHVVISRHPHDVAGMSTGTTWKTCMNMDGGNNKHYLEHDVKQGAHVAYLAHKDDHNLDHPIAMKTLKPFTHKESGHTVLRPEDRSYGNGGTAFDHTVRKWSEDKFPLKHIVYEKNPDIYNDDRNSFALSTDPKHLDDLVNHKDNYIRQAVALQHPNLKDHHVDKLLDDKNHGVKNSIIRNPNLKDHHINKLVNHKDSISRETIARHPKLKDHHIDKLVNDEDDYVRDGIARHPKLKDHHIDKLVNDKADYVRVAVARHPNLKDHHIDTLVDDKDDYIRSIVAQLPNLKKHHITKLLNDKDDQVRHNIASNPKV